MIFIFLLFLLLFFKTFKMAGGWRLCAHFGYHDGSCNVDLINCGQYSVFADEASGEHRNM